MPLPTETPHGQQATKLASSISADLGELYKLCHQTAPESPLCDTVGSIISAVAELEKALTELGPDLMPNTPDDGGMGQDQGMPTAGPGREYGPMLADSYNQQFNQ